MPANPSAQPQSLKGVVLRAFYYQGKVLEVGKSYELPRVFALEMKAANKFEIDKEPQAPAAPNPPSPSSPEARLEKKAAKKEGAKDAG